MKSGEGNDKDETYLKKRKDSLVTISFLQTLKENLGFEEAFEIAKKAFTKYMTTLYEEILKSTKRGSQERFDKFRKFYEEYAVKTPYLDIIESNSKILKVKYRRCPFFEVSKDFGLKELAFAFCLSDPGFTKKVLSKVKFTRKNVIAKGDSHCDNTWEFQG